MPAGPFFTSGNVPIVSQLELNKIQAGKIHRFWLQLITDGMGTPVSVPVFVAKGTEKGPVLGLTAAVHGNEINGIPVIQRLFREIDPARLHGTLVGVPVMNVPAVLQRQRRFFEESDLNAIMPGREDGNAAQVYAYRLVDRLVRHFDYLIDLHTAGFGRENSYHVKADLEDPVTRRMAMLQNAPIIVHSPPSDGSLRGVADSLGIHSIALEVGNPQSFQRGIIRTGLTGIHNLLHDLRMEEGEIEIPLSRPAICRHAYWVFSDTGGILSVQPNLGDWVHRGQPIASLRNIFGDLIKEYLAPEDGLLIGKSSDPINQTGGRILYLGVPASEGEIKI
ncbi:MAG: succinylglutamate desuccinylase/aspartoacylase family protein [Haliscomenobacter sp.]|nr:succinylglutamate desuccinylase/aspartoacylase family protein [Haliscomenobacter sp.]MBP9075946.1 succinylglutamate desuccinylase/aspartoacylase family protein [Haliscomenobacter sp.]MBP9873030.1 succinylglutamate desuccinylase/aspartoacylase family protein [Haliscomenobacter sp.]